MRFLVLETKSDIQAQKKFTRKYGREPPAMSIARSWHKKFMDTDTVLQIRGSWPNSNIRRQNLNLRVQHIPEAQKSLFAGVITQHSSTRFQCFTKHLVRFPKSSSFFV